LNESFDPQKGVFMPSSSRRSFLGGAGLAAAACVTKPLFGLAVTSSSPFKIAVINNEISQDFDHACSVAANDFGMQWIELREMWNKNIGALTDTQLVEAEKILAKYKLSVTDIASPLFKVDWPGAPRSQFSPKRDSFNADFDYKQQDEVLERSIALAKRFKTDKIRCFDFWRIDDVTPYRKDINARLQQAAEICGKQGLTLVIENEHACNTATGREAVKTLAAIPSPHFALNWDPGNAVMHGEMDAFPTAWEMLPKQRIHHCHVKNAIKDASGKVQWSPVDIGIIDWTAQFRALKKVGYRQAVSLETHWTGGGSPEESTRISWAGMKRNLEAAGAL
jgi:sugar phosphate isomerase/epimerase